MKTLVSNDQKYKNPKPEIVAENQANYPEIALLEKEDSINLELHVKEIEDAEKEIFDCTNYIKTGKVVKWENPINEVETLSFLELFNKANSIHNGEAYITGVKMQFAMDNDQNIILVYFPVVFHNKTQEPEDCELFSYQIKYGEAYVYSQEEKKFKEESNSQILIKKYKENIRLKHSDFSSDGFNNFIEGKDVDSMIFTFQEIFALMYDNTLNNQNRNIFESSNNDPVWIFNCIRKDFIYPNFQTKHSLLLSPNLEPKPLFNKKYANLAHLCPPNCDKAIFRLEKISTNC